MEIRERYGRLVYLGKDPNKDSRYSLFKCDCGNVKSIIKYNVKRGVTISCGCYQKANHSNCHRTYGFSHTRIDNIYKSMIARCHVPHGKNYEKYGAKGIAVCDEWRKDKKNFFEWAFANGYKEDLTLDRMDATKGYSPDNCRWATYQEQNNHRSSNHYVTINGTTRTISEWSRISGIAQSTIGARLRNGWESEEAVFKSVI